jgi:teichuronic acid biosynthesis glycosyltransferase TuaC
MRILFFSSIFPRPYDPTRGIYCFHLCSALAAKHEVKVVSPQTWLERCRHGDPSPSRRPCTRVLVAGLDVEYPWYFHTPRMLHTVYGSFMWLSVGRRLRRLVAEFKPDCVLSYWAHPDGEVAVRAAALAGVPAAVIVGGSDVLLLPRNRGRGRCITRVLRAADAVIAVSEDLRARAIDLGVNPERVHLIRQGIDQAQFFPGDRREARQRLGLRGAERLLVWVGKMVPVKGLEVLLRACAYLHQRGEPFRLCLVGDGPVRPALEAQSEAMGLAGVVSFVGPKLHHELPDWYRAADVTVLSSFSEGLPNVLRESLACGTPFVSTNVGGVREMAPPLFSRLVPAGDASALAAAIVQTLREPTATGLPPVLFQDWAAAADATLATLRVRPSQLESSLA